MTPWAPAWDVEPSYDYARERYDADLAYDRHPSHVCVDGHLCNDCISTEHEEHP